MAKMIRHSDAKKTPRKRRFREVKQKDKAHRIKQINGTKNVCHYASAGYKMKAFITDAFMLLMPIMFIVFYLVLDGREDFAAHRLQGWSYILLPLLVIQTIFMYKTGQTPGYKAYDMILIDEQTQKKPSLSTILFRNFCAFLSFFSMVGWILMFFRKDSKTLHDLLSATAVVYVHDKKS